MKIARFFAVLFGVIGTVLLVGTIGLCLFFRNAPARLQKVPDGAVSCAREMMEALADGDYEAASKRMYGKPDLGVHAAPSDEYGQMVWDAFVDAFSYEFTGECYVSGTDLCQDVTITYLNIPSVTEQWIGWHHTIFTAEIQAAEERGELSDIYDEKNDFRKDVVENALRESVEESLKQPATVTGKGTMKLVYRDEAWWVVPDEALLQAITGGV